jgi:hypothetical protein
MGVAARQQDDSECNLLCDGDSNQVCGGFNRLTLYVTPPPIIPEVTEVTALAFRALTGDSSDNAYNNLQQCAENCDNYPMFGMEKGTMRA